MDENKEQLSQFNKLIKEIYKNVEVPYYVRTGNLILSKHRGNDYNLEDIIQASQDMDVDTMREISMYYYQVSTSYRRIIDHMAGMFLYYYHMTLVDTEGETKESIRKKYAKALKTLDNLCGNGLCRDIVTEVLICGSYYGYINTFKNGESVLTALDPQYCRTRFKSIYNTDLVEFNVTYFDTLKDEIDFWKVLNNMPEEIVEHYWNWKKNKVLTPWANFPPHKACAFFLDSSDGLHLPPIFDTIVDIINFDEEKEMEKEKDAQSLEKLLVQRFKLDENGDLELFLEELAEIQKATAAMFRDNKYVDVLTTIAEEVDMIDSRNSSANSTATNNNIIKMMLPKYENAGLSSEIFYATTATSLNLSILNTTSFVGKLNDKIANWLSVFLYGNLSFGKMRPMVEILPVTWYNKDKMVTSYLTAAQNGYSKILPYIANGGKQSTLMASLDLENEILDLQDKLIPLSTSYTKTSSTEVGRPTKEDDEKTEETIRTEDSRGEIKNE